MADYTLKNGKATAVREDSGDQEAFVDVDINALSTQSPADGSAQFVVQVGAADPKKLFIATLRDYIFTSSRFTTLWVPASAMEPSQTQGASLVASEYPTNNLTNKVMRFTNVGNDTHAEFNVAFPSEWNDSNLKVKVFWSAGGAANPSDWVRFYIASRAYGDDDALDVILGAAYNIDDQLITDDDMHVTPASANIMVGGFPADENMVHFKLSRDYDYVGGGLALGANVDIFGVLFQYVKNEVMAAW